MKKLIYITILVLGSLLIVNRIQAMDFDYPPNHIIIPSIDISLPVFLAKESLNTWEVRLDGASYGELTALPGRNGNTVVFSHARQGLFINLPRIRKGDLVHLFTEKDWFVYRVIQTVAVEPEDIEVIHSRGRNELTLYTCTGDNYSKRFVVKTELVPNLAARQ